MPVLSFMSAFGPPKSPQSPQSPSFAPGQQEKQTGVPSQQLQYSQQQQPPSQQQQGYGAPPGYQSYHQQQQQQQQQQGGYPNSVGGSPHTATATPRDSPPLRARGDRIPSRPQSMMQTYQPPVMEIAQDTIPELQPIFTFLNSHANKLYQEGYFLRLNDLDSHGRPHADRSWTEAFAQLVGTVLSLWDAAALDAAGQDGEVAPTFINLADASIKMIETLPTRSADVQPLQNVLSISTAGKNRYLFHFNSLHSLTQWTAAIRLAMYENATLQEAYTGSLIAGKGKTLNNIHGIMERTKFKHEDWARVRFGAGTPWRRCWCVITPPDEKEVQKQQRQMKKKSAYERFKPLKGTVKFYDTKKITKKVSPIATINDAYSAYSIYPQSKPLIEQSTLIKVEGSITIHAAQDITTEGFIFIMPETHPAVTGFEIMLRFLFPLYDVFTLYGRPTRLIADTLDVRSLMFALPQERRYGYLEILDVAGLVHEKGSGSWSEREWRKRLRDLTSARMTRMTANGRPRSRASSYREYRNSLPSRGGGGLRYEDGASDRSRTSFADDSGPMPPPHTTSAPPDAQTFAPPGQSPARPRPPHQRSFSEAIPIVGDRRKYPPGQDLARNVVEAQMLGSRGASGGRTPPPPTPPPKGGFVPAELAQGPPPPAHGMPPSPENQFARGPMMAATSPSSGGLTREDSADSAGLNVGKRRPNPPNGPGPNGYPTTNQYPGSNQYPTSNQSPMPPPLQVATPPAFSHSPGAKPQRRPVVAPELQREHSRLSISTMQQMTDAGRPQGMPDAASGAAAAWRTTSHGSSNAGGAGGSPHGGNVNAMEEHGQRGVFHPQQ